MTSTATGREAEAAVADSLKLQKFEIIAKNWRTPTCETDLVAKKDGIIYFVEVKFRQIVAQGEGLDYITPKKIKQMIFAAETWCAQHSWEGDWRLLAVAVSVQGSNFAVGEPVEVS